MYQPLTTGLTGSGRPVCGSGTHRPSKAHDLPDRGRWRPKLAAAARARHRQTSTPVQERPPWPMRALTAHSGLAARPTWPMRAGTAHPGLGLDLSWPMCQDSRSTRRWPPQGNAAASPVDQGTGVPWRTLRDTRSVHAKSSQVSAAAFISRGRQLSAGPGSPPPVQGSRLARGGSLTV